MARAINAGVKVVGLKEMARDLKRVDAGLAKELREASKRVGEQLILPEAKRKAGQSRTNVAGGSTRAGGALTNTIRVLAQQASAQIAMGSAKEPYAAGMEWGSTGKRARARQFPLRQGKSTGFILYPTVKEKQDEIRAVYFAALEALLEDADL